MLPANAEASTQFLSRQMKYVASMRVAVYGEPSQTLDLE
jgi:hypothetical protein